MGESRSLVLGVAALALLAGPAEPTPLAQAELVNLFEGGRNDRLEGVLVLDGEVLVFPRRSTPISFAGKAARPMEADRARRFGHPLRDRQWLVSTTGHRKLALAQPEGRNGVTLKPLPLEGDAQPPVLRFDGPFGLEIGGGRVAGLLREGNDVRLVVYDRAGERIVDEPLKQPDMFELLDNDRIRIGTDEETLLFDLEGKAVFRAPRAARSSSSVDGDWQALFGRNDDGRHVATFFEGRSERFDVELGEPGRDAAISAASRRAVVFTDSSLQGVDLESGRVLWDSEAGGGDGQHARVRSVAFSPDGSSIAVGALRVEETPGRETGASGDPFRAGRASVVLELRGPDGERRYAVTLETETWNHRSPEIQWLDDGANLLVVTRDRVDVWRLESE